MFVKALLVSTLIYIGFSDFISPAHARAEIQEGQFIGDDETEKALVGWLDEIFKVAGLSIKPQIYILASHEVNAGATYGGQIVVYTGFLLKCQTVGQLLGVLAHEVGHIAGSHMAKQDAAQQQAMVPAILATLIGGAAAIASGNPASLLAGATGGMSIFERGLLKHSQSQEDSADSAALKYLELLHWPSDGLFEFLSALNHQYNGQIDPYTSTHPLTPDRMEKVHLYPKKSKSEIPAEYEKRFQRIRAKMAGFMNPLQKILQDYPQSDTSIPALYARSIAFYRSGDTKKALKIIDTELLTKSSGDPYFLELKGQMLFETGNLKGAVDAYKEARKQNPNGIGLNLLFGHALLELAVSNAAQNNKTTLQEAVQTLTLVTEKCPQSVFAWHLLAGAYGKMENHADAAGCLAEEAWLTGNIPFAKAQATKAAQSQNATFARRARDILKQIEQMG
ncbi:MAG: M48 family metalloprotease [Alphaproteobacteria bacterium]|nr:M48 family metalloprotease [Alphaproteobacteria bacterium]